MWGNYFVLGVRLFGGDLCVSLVIIFSKLVRAAHNSLVLMIVIIEKAIISGGQKVLLR